MNQRVFIIHRWDGNPDESWLKWLRLELKKKGFQVIAPQMPNADRPTIDEWVSTLATLVGVADETTHFVGHSIGCQTILRYLESVAPQKVGKVVFVAGWFNLVNLEDEEAEEIARPWIETPLDYEKIKASAKEIHVFLSDTDEWVPLSDKEIFEQQLNAKVHVEHGRGHFTQDDGVKEIPEIIDILSP